jgi:hypothetical protein
MREGYPAKREAEESGTDAVLSPAAQFILPRKRESYHFFWPFS